MAGEGPERQRLEERARALGLSDRVRFLGRRDDMADLMAASDVFVLTSLAEGMSNALLEAMATGLVVCAADIPANREVVSGGKDGLLFEPDAERLAAMLSEAIARATEDSGDVFPSPMGREARKTVEDRFSLDGVTRRYLSLYERLL
jgi:glycosyltransferase involved in cell wall biosynthesis